MSYKTDLQSNNIDLQNILDTINALPSGSSDSAWTIIYNVAYTSTMGDEPGEYLWTIDVSNIDLSNKKCVLVMLSDDEYSGVLFELDRNSISDSFIVRAGLNGASYSKSIIEDAQWVIVTDYIRADSSMKLIIKAL